MTSPDTKTLDPYLFLKDANGKVLAEDDDSGGFPNARITFTATKTGTYHIVASSFEGRGNGEFTLIMRENE